MSARSSQISPKTSFVRPRGSKQSLASNGSAYEGSNEGSSAPPTIAVRRRKNASEDSQSSSTLRRLAVLNSQAASLRAQPSRGSLQSLQPDGNSRGSSINGLDDEQLHGVLAKCPYRRGSSVDGLDSDQINGVLASQMPSHAAQLKNAAEHRERVARYNERRMAAVRYRGSQGSVGGPPLEGSDLDAGSLVHREDDPGEAIDPMPFVVLPGNQFAWKPSPECAPHQKETDTAAIPALLQDVDAQTYETRVIDSVSEQDHDSEWENDQRRIAWVKDLRARRARKAAKREEREREKDAGRAEKLRQKAAKKEVKAEAKRLKLTPENVHKASTSRAFAKIVVGSAPTPTSVAPFVSEAVQDGALLMSGALQAGAAPAADAAKQGKSKAKGKGKARVSGVPDADPDATEQPEPAQLPDYSDADEPAPERRRPEPKPRNKAKAAADKAKAEAAFQPSKPKPKDKESKARAAGDSSAATNADAARLGRSDSRTSTRPSRSHSRCAAPTRSAEEKGKAKLLPANADTPTAATRQAQRAAAKPEKKMACLSCCTVM